MVLIIMLIIVHAYKNLFAHKFYYYAYDSNIARTSLFSQDTNAHEQLNSTWPRLMNTFMKMASNSR